MGNEANSHSIHCLRRAICYRDLCIAAHRPQLASGFAPTANHDLFTIGDWRTFDVIPNPVPRPLLAQAISINAPFGSHHRYPNSRRTAYRVRLVGSRAGMDENTMGMDLQFGLDAVFRHLQTGYVSFLSYPVRQQDYLILAVIINLHELCRTCNILLFQK